MKRRIEQRTRRTHVDGRNDQLYGHGDQKQSALEESDDWHELGDLVGREDGLTGDTG